MASNETGWKLYPQANDWELVGVAEGWLLWQHDSGLLNFWRMNDLLVVGVLSAQAPAGYRARSLAPEWNPAAGCVPEVGGQFYLLFEDGAGTSDPLVWLVDLGGNKVLTYRLLATRSKSISWGESARSGVAHRMIFVTSAGHILF